MKNLKFCITCLVAGGLLLTLTPQSLADIIVVEGRLTDDGDRAVAATDDTDDATTSTALSLPTIVFVPLVPPAHNNGNDEAPVVPEPPKANADNCDDELSDDLCEMDEEPEGYTCEDIGHGMELCEKTGDDEEGEADVEENEETGCSASGGLNPSTPLLGFLLFAFWGLRRNRAIRS